MINMIALFFAALGFFIIVAIFNLLKKRQIQTTIIPPKAEQNIATFNSRAYFEEYRTMSQVPKDYLNFATTFVTGLINPDESRPSDKTPEKYFEHFAKLVNSKIELHVFLSECYLEKFNQLYSGFNNIYVEVVKFEDLYIYKELIDLEFDLPKIRCKVKDTKNYMIIQHSKIEFMRTAIKRNIFRNRQFAWIDFGIAHVVKNKSTFDILTNLEIKPPGIYAASEKKKNNQEDFDNVNWRFQGGFYMGDITNLSEFIELYLLEFKKTIQEKKILTWEVNYWQYLEYKFNLNIITYPSHANDSIIYNLR